MIPTEIKVRENRRENQEWTIQCTVNTLTTPYGIPIEAQFIKSASIGATGLPGESITVDHWSSTDGNNKYYGTVSSPGCYPIEYTFYSTSLITMT